MTENNRFIEYQPDVRVDLSLEWAGKDITHLFEKTHVDAINTAIACRRPLLLTGEPGVGKTQLARAVAKKLGRAFIRHTVDAKTESRDLLWRFDAVARLAEAQVAQHCGWDEKTCMEKLDQANYVRPGPLWWGLNWTSAKEQPGAAPPPQPDKGDPAKGVVVLIDEIDKAEVDVPNGLLEALGDGSFHPVGLKEPVRAGEEPPFIVITTNRERGLPDAFVRRCVVLPMRLPEEDAAFKALLVERGRAHSGLPEEILKEAAAMLLLDRKNTRRLPLPGQAEYLDLLRAVEEQAATGGQSPADLLAMAQPYLFQKSKAL